MKNLEFTYKIGKNGKPINDSFIFDEKIYRDERNNHINLVDDYLLKKNITNYHVIEIQKKEINTLNVYQFDSGEQEYIAANSIDEAKQFYTEMIGETDFEDFEIKEFPKDKWDSFNITYPDDDDKEDQTIKEVMSTIKKPEYICSTIY